MNRIFGYILNMFPYMLIAIPVVILIRVISCSFLKKKEHKTTVWHELGVCLFFLFLVGLFSQTIIPAVRCSEPRLEISYASMRSG